MLEALLLEKYKGVVFWDLDTKVNFTIHNVNLEFRCGKGVECNPIVDSSDESGEDEGSVVEEMNIRMIKETEQAKEVEDILADKTEEDEEVPRDIWATGKPEGGDEDGTTSC